MTNLKINVDTFHLCQLFHSINTVSVNSKKYSDYAHVKVVQKNDKYSREHASPSHHSCSQSPSYAWSTERDEGSGQIMPNP